MTYKCRPQRPAARCAHLCPQFMHTAIVPCSINPSTYRTLSQTLYKHRSAITETNHYQIIITFSVTWVCSAHLVLRSKDLRLSSTKLEEKNSSLRNGRSSEDLESFQTGLAQIVLETCLGFSLHYRSLSKWIKNVFSIDYNVTFLSDAKVSSFPRSPITPNSLISSRILIQIPSSHEK